MSTTGTSTTFESMQAELAEVTARLREMTPAERKSDAAVELRDRQTQLKSALARSAGTIERLRERAQMVLAAAQEDARRLEEVSRSAEREAKAREKARERLAAECRVDESASRAERHAVVHRLYDARLFTNSEIARLAGYANGGVVGNIVSGRRQIAKPLTEEERALVAEIEAKTGRTIAQLARAARVKPAE